MKVTYGATTLQNSASVQISRTTRRSPSGQAIGYTERWTIQGWVTGADAGAITTAVGAIITGFAADAQDLGLYTDGDVATAHILATASCIGGTRVVERPSFPEGAGPEYANVRHFQVVIEGDVDDAGAASLLSFQESISVTGTGGGRFVLLTPLSGQPVKQDVTTASPVTIVQAGTAIGRTAYPNVPAPLFAGDEHVERRQISRRVLDRLPDGSLRNFETVWSYEFEFASGGNNSTNPHTWGS